MPQPYNYIIDASAPDNRVFETIQGMRGMRDERLLQERAMAESQAASQALQELGRTKHIGASQINQFKIAHPNYHKQFTDVLDSLGEQTKGSVRSSILKIKMLDKSGRHEEAKAEAKRIAKAHENSGNDEGSGLFNTLASSMEADKEGTSGLIDVVGAEMLGDDYYKALDQASVTPVNVAKTEAETAAKVGEENRAEGMAETNLALKKEELNKAIETVKQMTDSTGKVPPDQRFAATETMRKAYQSEAKDFIQIDKHYQDLMNAKLTGIGGMNTILSFYKIKDPASIVSTNELNAAMDSSGMTDSVKKTVLRLFEGGELTETARKNFKEEATSMWKSAKSEADKTRNRLGALAKKSGLDPKDFMNPEREVKPDVSPPSGSTGNAPSFLQKYSKP